MSQYNKIFENSQYAKKNSSILGISENNKDLSSIEKLARDIGYINRKNNIINSQFVKKNSSILGISENNKDLSIIKKLARDIGYINRENNIINLQFVKETAEQIRHASAVNNIVKNDLIFADKIINSENYNLDNVISKNNNMEEIDKENFITIFIYEVIKIREYFNSSLKNISKNIGDIADIVTILSVILGFLPNFQSNNEGSNNITYNYNISINNYNISTDSYLTNLEIGFTNKDTMLYSKSNESLEEITHLCFGLRVKIIDKCSELTQIEVNKNGIILKGWVRSDDINILK